MLFYINFFLTIVVLLGSWIDDPQNQVNSAPLGVSGGGDMPQPSEICGQKALTELCIIHHLPHFLNCLKKPENLIWMPRTISYCLDKDCLIVWDLCEEYSYLIPTDGINSTMARQEENAPKPSIVALGFFGSILCLVVCFILASGCCYSTSSSSNPTLRRVKKLFPKITIYGSTNNPPSPHSSLASTFPTPVTPATATTDTTENIEMTARLDAAKASNYASADVDAIYAAVFEGDNVNTTQCPTLTPEETIAAATIAADKLYATSIENFNFNLSAVVQAATTFTTKAQVHKPAQAAAAAAASMASTKLPLVDNDNDKDNKTAKTKTILLPPSNLGARPKTTKKVSFLNKVRKTAAKKNAVGRVSEIDKNASLAKKLAIETKQQHSNKSKSLNFSSLNVQKKNLTEAQYNKIAFELIEMDKQADLDLKNDMALEIVREAAEIKTAKVKAKIAKAKTNFRKPTFAFASAAAALSTSDTAAVAEGKSKSKTLPSKITVLSTCDADTNVEGATALPVSCCSTTKSDKTTAGDKTTTQTLHKRKNIRRLIKLVKNKMA